MLGKVFDLSLRKLQNKRCDLPKKEMMCSSILRKAKEKIGDASTKDASNRSLKIVI
jgi:hypothetical protein